MNSTSPSLALTTAIVTANGSFGGRVTILKTQVADCRQQTPDSHPRMRVYYPTLADLKQHYPEQLGYKCQTLNCPIEERR